MECKSSIICFFIVFMAFAQNDSGDKIEKAKFILDSIVHQNSHVGISAAIMAKGKTVLAQGFGYKNIETKEVVDQNTVFRIYSISKPLTGLLAMKMVEEKKLNINAEIGRILPSLPKHLHQITSKHLLAHISGIRHYKDGWKEWDSISQFRCKTPLEALDVFVRDSLLLNPGEQVSYTSFGYVLLSAILEKVGKKPFTELMEEKIFVPSEAKRIQLDGPIETYPENITSFYDIENGKIVKTRPVNNSCKFGGGGFNAPAHAIAKIWRAYMSKRTINEESYEYSKQQVKPKNGEMIYTSNLGIGTNTRNGRTSMLSNGAGPGGRSTVYMYPDDQVVVVLISNTLGDKVQKEAIQIARLFVNN